MDQTRQDKHSPTLIQRAYAKSCDILNDSTEYFSSLSIGQSFLKHTDRLLWMVEKCAEWSVPTASVPKQSTSNGAFGKPGPLVRPLPWIFFLPMLLLLRVVRLSLNIGAMFIGMESVKPSQMVRFIQVRRRRIRALKFLGLRRIRQKKIEQTQQLTWRETFYNVMSRAMCFRVTNSDLYEQITVRNDSSDQLQTSTSQSKNLSGRDLKRKYIEILKNNYVDWEDVEDDEELIDRITQLAEDQTDDSDFVPAEEDSATEEDSMSDAEDDAAVVCHSPSQSVLQRLSSHGSLHNEIIAEENEEENADSDSTTVSNNSNDESTQHTSKSETPKKPEIKSDNLTVTNVESGVSADEFYSPLNSISASPDQKIDRELPQCNTQKNKQETTNVKLDDKKETENLIKAEKNQDVNNG